MGGGGGLGGGGDVGRAPAGMLVGRLVPEGCRIEPNVGMEGLWVTGPLSRRLCARITTCLEESLEGGLGAGLTGTTF